MKLINATDLDRKSGGAKWRDLQSSRSSRSLILSIQVANLPESTRPLVIPTGSAVSFPAVTHPLNFRFA
jgi:hypothetical protein